MSLLFTPKSIGKMVVKNRFVHAATGEKMCTPDGKCTDEMIDFYRESAEGGVGMIILGQSYVHESGCGIPKVIGLHMDAVVEGYRKLTDELHVCDTRVAAQLGHAGRSVFSHFSISHRAAHGYAPMGPSPVKDVITGIKPREMTEDDIQKLIVCYAQAARRAKEAGFDAVELHACHGDMVSSFLSPYSNRRRDKWGGNIENWVRFTLTIYEKIRELVGDDYPVMIKMNATDYIDGGITIDLSKRYAEKISAVGFDAIELSAGTHNERQFNIMRGDIPEAYPKNKAKTEYERRKFTKIFKAMKDEVKHEEAYLRPFAKEIKKVIGDTPLILPGGLRTVSVMEDILAEGDADFIGLCRPLLRDPYFPNKVRKGLKRSDCLNCNLCMLVSPVACGQRLYRPPHL